jgi:steroid Delta-isomerase
VTVPEENGSMAPQHIDLVRDPRLARLTVFYETLTPQTLPRIGEVYSPAARFIDPFNDVSGLPAVQRVFEHMFQNLQAPRFVVMEALAAERSGFLLWTMHFRRGNGREQQILGTTHVRFDDAGLVLLHHDHWDAAGQLYETLPVLGALMRWLKRRLSATPST